MNSVVNLNNEGSAYLRAGTYNAAIVSFSSAMEALRLIPTFEDPHASVLVANEASIFLRRHTSWIDHDQTFVTEAGDTVCDQAFDLVSAHEDDTALSTTDIDFHICTVTLLVNIALCFHVRAMASSSSFRDVKRAKTFYMLGVKAFEVIQANLPTSPLPPHVYTLLAVLRNNLGCIAMQDRDYKTLAKCMGFLQSHIQGIVASEATLNHNNDATSDALDRVWRNQESWRTAHTNPAPAA